MTQFNEYCTPMTPNEKFRDLYKHVDKLYVDIENIDTTGGSGQTINNFIDFKEFGAFGDGLTDDSRLMQTALDELESKGGGTLYFPPSTYLLDFRVHIPSNVIIDFGGSTLDCRKNTGVIFEVKGSINDDERFFTLDATKGSEKVTIDSTSGLSIGDFVFLKENTILGSTSQMVGQIFKIVSMSGNEVTLDTHLEDDYSIVNNARLDKVNFIDKITFKNGYVLGSDYSNDLVTGIHFEYARDILVDNMKFKHTHYCGIQFIDCVNGLVRNSQFNDILYPGLAYGIAMSWACDNIVIDTCNGANMRHLVTTGGGASRNGVPRNITAIKCHTRNMLDSGFDCHPSGRNISFISNVVDGYINDGIVFQASSGVIRDNVVNGNQTGRHGILIQASSTDAMDIIIDGNTIKDTNNYGISIGMSDTYNIVDRLQIMNNNIKTALSGIYMSVGLTSNVKNVEVLTNKIENITSHGIYVRCGEDSIIKGNIIRGGTGSVQGIYLHTSPKSILSNNVIEWTGVYPIRVIASSDTMIMGNRIGGTGNTYAVHCDVPSDYVLISNNNIRNSDGGGIYNTAVNGVNVNNI